MKAPIERSPICNESDFKGWAIQNPNARKLLVEVMFRWRASNIPVRGKSGPWAVYPLEQWGVWSGLSFDQVKRALRVLEVDGFLLRERHRFRGSVVLAFLQLTCPPEFPSV